MQEAVGPSPVLHLVAVVKGVSVCSACSCGICPCSLHVPHLVRLLCLQDGLHVLNEAHLHHAINLIQHTVPAGSARGRGPVRGR